MICKLISEILLIPHLSISEGETLVIGRNRKCKIKNLLCSRNYCSVELNDNKLQVVYLKSNNSMILKSGDSIQGPGFKYKVKIVNDLPEISNCSMSQDLEDIIWSEYDCGKVIIGNYLGGGNPSPLIAAFDYDGTIVETISGKAFSINQDDWKLVHSKLPDYLQTVVQNGYRFIIVSNQLGLSKGKTDKNQLKKKFNDSLKRIKVPCLILIATEDDVYRKPRIKLWTYIEESAQPGVSIDLHKSFYVGDAAGRKKSLNRKADHSSADLYFAINCGVKFLLPEQFFQCMLNQNFDIQSVKNCPLPQSGFSPSQINSKEVLIETAENGQTVDNIRTILPSALHCIIFCGIAGSGKSTFYRNYLQSLNYVHINLDTLKSMNNCMSLAKKSFDASKNCIIDNTNVDKVSRMKWIELCKQCNVVAFIFYFKLPLEHIFHNNKFRKLTNTGNAVADVIIYSQNKKFEMPSVDEGVKQVFIIHFVPKFTDQTQKRLYSMYLNDK